MTDENKIEAFCIFQSFFMGNYYAVFDRLVDTSTLEHSPRINTGCWIATAFEKAIQTGPSPVTLAIIHGKHGHHNGLVSPGTSPALLSVEVIEGSGAVEGSINEDNPDEDVEFGIEADREGNPDTSLICARYKGRRVAAVTPAETDYRFCKNYVPPQSDEKPMPNQRTKLDHGMSVRLSDIMTPSANLTLLRDINTAILFQALDRPKLRYIGAALYSTFCTCRIAPDSIQTAKDVASLMVNGNGTGYKSPIVLIAGLTTSSKLDRCIASTYTTRKMYVITKEEKGA
ncbi:hypothetical protein SAMD00023353_10600010 [Rosellinia necatrix]|uniref:Uncharacterized protein n=1 Tax=Rosellinia necatrix TaxID=77044 RepID=A0A1S7UM98_ROSNE|nr:hypothetical protein SAMD00023353_10600010 [Rosellinia necatrix]